MNIDYDLFVIDPENEDTTPEQLRACLHDALTVLEKRVTNLEKPKPFHPDHLKRMGVGVVEGSDV